MTKIYTSALHALQRSAYVLLPTLFQIWIVQLFVRRDLRPNPGGLSMCSFFPYVGLRRLPVDLLRTSPFMHELHIEGHRISHARQGDRPAQQRDRLEAVFVLMRRPELLHFGDHVHIPQYAHLHPRAGVLSDAAEAQILVLDVEERDPRGAVPGHVPAHHPIPQAVSGEGGRQRADGQRALSGRGLNVKIEKKESEKHPCNRMNNTVMLFLYIDFFDCTNYIAS